MEKKKVNILTFLLIVAVIIIVVMGFYIYKSSEEKVNENSNDTTNTELSNVEANIVTNVENENESLEKMAKEVLDDYIVLHVYERSSIGPMPYILVKLGLETEENIEELCKGVGNKTEYIKSNTKYEEFKNSLLEYVTEEYFSIYFSQYKNMDGYVGFCATAAGLGTTEIEAVEMVSNNGEDYIFNVTFKDSELYDNYLNGEDIEEDSCFFNKDVTFKMVNDKLVISEFLGGDILVEGVYAYEASDVAYEFYKDGRVEYSTNMTVDSGFYVTVGENEIELRFTERTIWDEEEAGKTTTEEISRTEKAEVVDDKKLIIEYEVDGEIHKGEIIKFDVE